MKRVLFTLLLVALPSFAAAQAENYPLTDLSHRVQVSLRGNALWVPATESTPSWRGGEVGGAVTYSLHHLFSVFGMYRHGFPVDQVDGQRNTLQASAELRVHPGPSGEPITGAHLYLGAGMIWMGRETIQDFKGYEGHVNGSWLINKKWAFVAGYQHAFSLFPDRYPDQNLLHVGVAAKLYP